MHALVIGLGVSGKAAALLLKSKGYTVTGVDAKPKEIEGIRVLPESAVEDLNEFDLIVLSPGIAGQPSVDRRRKQGTTKTMIGESSARLLLILEPMRAGDHRDERQNNGDALGESMCSALRDARPRARRQMWGWLYVNTRCRLTLMRLSS